MANNNILKQYYWPWRYPSNWFRNVKIFFRSLKWAQQRVIRGYSDCDIWNFDSYLSEVLSGGLKQLADIAHGYPGVGEYNTFEKWQNDLYRIAEMIAEAEKACDDDDFTVDKYQAAEKQRKEAFDWINENFHSLWD